MMAVLNRLRGSLLFLALVFVSIPGIKDHDLVVGSISLGRFQPFKPLFVAWMLTQAAWLLHSPAKRSRLLASIRSARPAVWVLVASAIVMLASLTVGLNIQGGGIHGWNVLTSFFLGSIAALVTCLDDEFEIKPVYYGLAGATLVLAIFAGFERFAPGSSVVQTFISSAMDSNTVTNQAGSTLTPSALAEFCVRVIPIYIPIVLTGLPWLAITSILALLALMTVTRSALISMSAMAALWLFLKENRRYMARLAVACAIAGTAAVAIMGPQRIYGRYIGWLLTPAAQDSLGYSRGAKSSADERVALAKGSVAVIKAHPWTGIGLNGFSHRIESHLPPLYEESLVLHTAHTHDLYLEIMVSGGILALLGLIGLLLSTIWVSMVPRVETALAFYCVGQALGMAFDARIYVSWLAITWPWFGALAWKSRMRRAAVIEPRAQ